MLKDKTKKKKRNLLPHATLRVKYFYNLKKMLK